MTATKTTPSPHGIVTDWAALTDLDTDEIVPGFYQFLATGEIIRVTPLENDDQFPCRVELGTIVRPRYWDDWSGWLPASADTYERYAPPTPSGFKTASELAKWLGAEFITPMCR